jgi:hypothetical protein
MILISIAGVVLALITVLTVRTLGPMLLRSVGALLLLLCIVLAPFIVIAAFAGAWWLLATFPLLGIAALIAWGVWKGNQPKDG